MTSKSTPTWTWSDKEDDFLYHHGKTILCVAGRTKAIQAFIEALSHKIGSKCDFAFAAGRAHIDVHPEAVDKALTTLQDDTFLNQFLVPYSEESYRNETYFQILK